MLEINKNLRVPLREFSFSFSRSSGAGGQNVNKVNTRVTLRWNVAASPALSAGVRQRFLERYRHRINQDGELVLHSQRFRDQGRNVADSLERLRKMLADVAVPEKPRRPTRPTRAAKEKRLRQKRAKSERKARRQTPGADD